MVEESIFSCPYILFYKSPFFIVLEGYFCEKMVPQKRVEDLLYGQGVPDDFDGIFVVEWAGIEVSEAQIVYAKKRLFPPYFSRNNLFDRKFRFITYGDYQKNEEFFTKKYGNKIIFIRFKSGEIR